MKIAYDFESLERFLAAASKISTEYPVVVSEFITDARELDFDAVAQDGKII